MTLSQVMLHQLTPPLKFKPVVSKVVAGSKLVSEFDALSSGEDTLTFPTTPTRTSILVTGDTPKISQFLGLSSWGESSIISYFGPMNFLDDQARFSNLFGSKPQFFGSNPSRLDADDPVRFVSSLESYLWNTGLILGIV